VLVRGRLDSVEWNGGLEHWNGTMEWNRMVNWNGGLKHQLNWVAAISQQLV